MAKGLSSISRTSRNRNRSQKLGSSGQSAVNINTLGQTPANAAYANQINTYSNPNVTNPFGSQNITIGPDGRPQITQTLSQGEQEKLQGQTAYDKQVNEMSQKILSGVDPNAVNGDYTAARQKADDLSWNAAKSRLDPQWARASQEFQQSLANRGIGVGDPAYKRALETYQQGQNDAYLQAQNTAFQAGGQEVDRARNTALTPYAALGSLRNTYSGANIPSFQNYNAPNLQAPDIMGGATALNASANSLKGQQIAANASTTNAQIAANANKPKDRSNVVFNVGG